MNDHSNQAPRFGEAGFSVDGDRGLLVGVCSNTELALRHQERLSIGLVGVIDPSALGGLGRADSSIRTLPAYASLEDYTRLADRHADTVIVGALAERLGEMDSERAFRAIADQAISMSCSLFYPADASSPALLEKEADFAAAGLSLWGRLGESAEPPSCLPYVPSPLVAVLSVYPDRAYEEVALLMSSALRTAGSHTTTISGNPYASLWGASWALPWHDLCNMSPSRMIEFVSRNADNLFSRSRPDIAVMSLPNDPANVPCESNGRAIRLLDQMLVSQALLHVLPPDGVVLSCRYGTRPEDLAHAGSALSGLGIECLATVIGSDRYYEPGDSIPLGKLDRSESTEYAAMLQSMLNQPCYCSGDPGWAAALADTVRARYGLRPKIRVKG